MANNVSSSLAETHLRTLTRLSLLSRILVALVVVSSTYLLTPFDGSARLVLDETVPGWVSSLHRWDTFHFALVAQDGYAYEHSWAFFPALPFVMRASGHVLARLGLTAPGTTAHLVGGAVLAAAFDSTRTFYRLSLHHLRSPPAAFLATALSLLSSSPATLRFAPYNEPFYTYCAYRGMWACARERWAVASAWFALAGAFRSNGVMLGGYVLWGMLVEPCLVTRQTRQLTLVRVLRCIALAAVPLVPFVYHNYTGYVAFCAGAERPGWCERTVPSIYTHVQRAYWDVGFLRYWTLSNVPNFLLAFPVLANVYAFGWVYLLRVYPWLRGKTVRTPTVFFAPSLLPHVLHGLALTVILTFNAHVQIALRVSPSLPVLYWAAAWMMVERPGWGRAWVMWSVLWGAASCVLWAVFLPPA